MSKIRDHYMPDNIVGPVTQSGGIPTGAIIESGSNAYGGYIKYADGTLECYSTDFNSNIPNGTTTPVTGITGMFKSSDVIFTFAKPFIAIPNVVIAAIRASSDNNEVWAQVRGITTTTVTARMISNLNSTTIGSIFYYKATGRWF